MLTINTRYERVAPNGDVSIINIASPDELTYHEGLSSSGFQYKEIRVSTPADSTCVNCEG